MNKVEAMKREKDGLDVWADLLRHAAQDTPVEDIPDDDLQRMKWYGVFHRPQRPGTFMLRLRITGGQLSTRQLQTIAAVSRRWARGDADLTSRQAVQLRDLRLRDIPAALQALSDAGLQTLQTGMDNVRNFIGCPLAGVDGMELFDSTPILVAMAEAHMVARGEFSNLPRKVNVSVAGCRDDCGHAQTQDLGLIPATRDIDGRRVAGFNVFVGGALGGSSPRLASDLDVFLRPRETVPFFLALLRIYRDNGPRDIRTKARLKWLLEEWGEARLRQALEESLGHPLEHAGSDERLQIAGDHLGIHPQRQVGMNYAGLHVAVGRITADQMDEVARLAETYGSGAIRITTDQNIVLTGIPDAHLAGLLAEPVLQELRLNPPPVWRNLIACTGSDYCHYSLIDTKRNAVKLATELERRGVQIPRGTRIHISGCVHACGKHHMADIGLQGTNMRLGSRVEESVDLYAGGRLGADPQLAKKLLQGVHMEDLPVLVEALVRQQFQQVVPLAIEPLYEFEADEIAG